MAAKKPITPAPAPAPAVNYKQTYDTYYNQVSGQVNQYVDELIKKAQGDYDFAAKWIESQYKIALGSDNGAGAQFLKQVANGLEEKVGRIAYDYQTGTFRLNQDADLSEIRTVRNRDQALSRLDQDEAEYKRTFQNELDQGRREQDASLNERGVLSTPRDQATGLAGREVREFEQGANDQLSAYERALSRDREDINLSASDTLQDSGIARSRGLDDLTTSARRAGIDATNDQQYQSEAAKRALDKAKLEAESQRRTLLNQSRSYADYLARGASGL